MSDTAERRRRILSRADRAAARGDGAAWVKLHMLAGELPTLRLGPETAHK